MTASATNTSDAWFATSAALFQTRTRSVRDLDHDGGVSPPTFAAGVRLPFAQLPAAVAEWVARTLGGSITDVVDKQGGFSPGVAAVVTTTSGARGFVKAVGTSINAESVQFHRAENAVMVRMPLNDWILRPVASESIQVDADEWEVTILPVIDGATAAHPWSESDALRVLDALVDLGTQFTPSPWPDDPARTKQLVAFFRGWTRIERETDDPWHAHPWIARHFDDLLALEPVLAARLPGDTLSHTDLRADNVMLTDDRVWLIDWAHARNAARWVDPVLLMCDVVASGADREDGGDIDVPKLFATHRAFDGASTELVGAVIATLAATWHWFALQPPPPGLPTIRAFQDCQADSLLRYVVRHFPDGLRIGAPG